jgi:hypothetical protein
MAVTAVTAIDRAVNLRLIIHAALGPHCEDFEKVRMQAAPDPRIEVKGTL